MEATARDRSRRVVAYSIPAKDYAFLRRLSTSMGWERIPQPKKRKTRLQVSIEEAHKGPLYRFDSVEDMMKHLMSDED